MQPKEISRNTSRENSYWNSIYEQRAKMFYELRLGSMTMKELSNKFLSLL